MYVNSDYKCWRTKSITIIIISDRGRSCLPRTQPIEWHSPQRKQEGSEKERLGCGGAEGDPVSAPALHPNRAHLTSQQWRSRRRSQCYLSIFSQLLCFYDWCFWVIVTFIDWALIHILHYSQLKRGLISTPPSDMLPTAEGGKANAWLRQKNAGIYVRPRLFSPYVEEAKVRFIYLWLMGVIDRAETGGIFVSHIAIAKVSRVSVKGAG